MKIIRYNPNINIGLTNEQVEERYRTNLVNKDNSIKTKSIPQIVLTSTINLFNLLNIFLAICIISVGAYKNVLFLGVIICNTVIGIVQEIKAKLIIDKLNLINASKIKVIRNGVEQEVNHDELVLDDLIILNKGSQVVVDSIILSGTCEINQQAITGEDNSIEKEVNDEILSGSYIVSGYVIARVNHLGDDNYISVISKDAKKQKKAKSEILSSLNNIIKIISIIIVPLGLILFYIQYNLTGNNLSNAVVNTVAALLIMIPDGLILLTSTVFAIGAIRMSRYKILVQNLYCSENLARIDTLCLDKTGTITDGLMEVKDIIPVNTSTNDIKNILGEFSYFSKDDNAVMKAIRKNYSKESSKKIKKLIAFSSKKKYSGVMFDEGITYILGAPEFVLKDNYNKISNTVDKYINEYRVLLIAKSKYEFVDDKLPKDIEPCGLILLQDKIRSNAKETLQFFKEQGVELKIISGDNPKTISSIAKRSGFNKLLSIDTSNLSDEELEEAVEKYNIFGRTSPFQKKTIINCLQKNNHKVAFIGDGVNDVLALKQSDCSITLSNAEEAARNTAELVLLDSSFCNVPYIVRDGRRNINNLERSSILFLTKTMYAALLAIIFLFVDAFYPFIPIQTSLISVTTIGIPSFVLALEKNNDIVRGKFLLNVLKRAIPGSIAVVLNILIILILSRILKLQPVEVSTLSVILTAFTGFMVIYKLSIPFNKLRISLLISMIILFFALYLLAPSLFSLAYLTSKNVVLLIILIISAIIIYGFINLITTKIFKKEYTN